MSEFREIFVKAVCGRDRHVCRDTVQLRAERAIDEVLGCKVTRHRYAGLTSSQGVKVNGSYELHLWVSDADSQGTHILSRTVDYNRLIPYADLGVNPAETTDAEVSVTVTHGPLIADTTLADPRTAQVSVEIGYLIEVVGDARLCVRHYPGACEDGLKKDDNYSGFIDDDLEEDFEDFEDDGTEDDLEQTA